MGFYATTENPNVMMRENQNTQSSEYIIIYEDELLCQLHLKKSYIHYKTNTRSIFLFKINIHVILVEEIFVNVKSSNILKVLCQC